MIRLKRLISTVFEINSCHLTFFVPVLVRGQNGSEDVVDSQKTLSHLTHLSQSKSPQGQSDSKMC